MALLSAPSPVARKIFVILAITLLLGIALQLIRGIVAERQQRSTEAEAGVAGALGGRQRIAGPFLVVHVRDVVPERTGNGAFLPEEARALTPKNPELKSRVLHIEPDTLDLKGRAEVSPRHRGIFTVQTFRFDGELSGRFRISPRFGLNAERAALVERVELIVAVTDARGLRGRPAIRFAGRDITPTGGTVGAALGDGFRAVLDPAVLMAGGEFDYAVRLAIEGTGQLDLVPAGDDTSVRLESNWPHPSFEGAFLPAAHAIGEGGFDATWQSTLLATNLYNKVTSCVATPSSSCALPAMAVRFIEPVNVYQRAERALKYGLLFIALTFGAFFLFETMKAWRMHPLQYMLVGFALALFFLLVTSLAEHIPFRWAYAGAATACVTLITGYLRHVLGGWARAGGFGGLLVLLYGTLYGLLLSEDNALMLGSLLLFAVLAAAMWITRKVDWYALPAARGHAQAS